MISLMLDILFWGDSTFLKRGIQKKWRDKTLFETKIWMMHLTNFYENSLFLSFLAKQLFQI